MANVPIRRNGSTRVAGQSKDNRIDLKLTAILAIVTTAYFFAGKIFYQKRSIEELFDIQKVYIWFRYRRLLIAYCSGGDKDSKFNRRPISEEASH